MSACLTPECEVAALPGSRWCVHHTGQPLGPPPFAYPTVRVHRLAAPPQQSPYAGGLAPLLERIALELEIGNRHLFLELAKFAAVDKAVLPEVEAARVALNRCIARRVT